MTNSRKAFFFLVELINCYAGVFYSNFLFFYMKSRFGFGELENVLLAALNGLVYMVAAWKGGAFAQRYGPVRSVYVGFGIFAAAMIFGLLAHSAWAHVFIFAVWTLSGCFIWPAIESLVSAGSGNKLSDMVGYYNIIWAGGAATAYFTAGIVLERFGMQSLFLVPLALVIIETIILSVTGWKAKTGVDTAVDSGAPHVIAPPADGRRFMHMAWLANPLSYIAINTVIPLIPTISDTLGLSTAATGIVCSVWMFVRLGAFGILWRWTGWHYRFRWLAGSLFVLVVSFTAVVLARSVAILLVAEIGFGLSIGLIYYSSLYYSMHASDKQSANGGLHEAMIGAGMFLGPVCRAGAAVLLPVAAHAGSWPVSGLLAGGFSALLWMGRFRIIKKRMSR